MHLLVEVQHARCIGADSMGAITPTTINLWGDAIIFTPTDRLKIQHQPVNYALA